MRPGLTVRAGDGGLSLHGWRQLGWAAEKGRLKKILTEYTSERKYYHPLFDLDAEVELRADNSAEAVMWFYRQPHGPLAAYVKVISRLPLAPNDVRSSQPVRVFLSIDGRPMEPDHWGEVRMPGRPPVRTLLAPGWTLDRQSRARVEAEFMAELLKGQTATVETTLNNGETYSATFDLSGLNEALKLMEQKMAEGEAAVAREIAELKKRLAALE